MFAEFKAGQEINKKAAIAYHFRDLDSAGEMDHPDLFTLLISTYIKQYGALNYRMLEESFRANDFSAHLLAVPTEHILANNPHPNKIVADTNTLFMDNIYQRTPFGVQIFRNEKDMQWYIDRQELSYDKESNLRNLAIAGGIYRKGRGLTHPPKHDITLAHLN